MSVVFGLTGPFGSGCTIIAEKIFGGEPYNAHIVKLSDIIKEQPQYSEVVASKGGENITREDMQGIGDRIRKDNINAGQLAVYANEKIERIEKTKAKKEREGQLYVIDGIRNPGEVKELKKNGQFYLFAITADINNGERDYVELDKTNKAITVPKKIKGRWERVQDKYKKDGNPDRAQYKIDEERDRESTDKNGEKDEFGQQVLECYQMADIIIDNSFEIKDVEKFNDDISKQLSLTVQNYINLILHKENHNKAFGPKTKFIPTTFESKMVMAYANSLLSTCIKRQVGAIITDSNGDVISSGYNEVPRANNGIIKPCRGECGDCFRTSKKIEHKERVKRELAKIFTEEDINKINFEKIAPKFLDYCRALHAEERAIINIARSGAEYGDKATLFTTTFTCNMCANKVVELGGIHEVVYSEPYPIKEAIDILKSARIKVTPYQGVTHKGYFRLMEDNK